jgi:two-component system response regulator
MNCIQLLKDVLFVEDNLGHQDLMQIAFEENCIPHHLHIVNNGEEALNFLYRQGKYALSPRPNLILLDLNLPRMDGKEILKIIKKDQILKLIPVIVFTTSHNQSDILTSYELQANCYISKPYDLDDFFRTVKSCIDFWINFSSVPRLEDL